MKNSIKDNAQRLFEEGYSAKEIAVELAGQAAQSTIYRWVDEFEAESDFLHGIADPPDQNDDSEIKEESYEQNDDQEFEDVKDEDGDSEEYYLDKEMDDQPAINPESEIEIRKAKRSVEKKIRKLFNAILAHSSGHEWSHSQITRMLSALTSTQETIEEIYEYDPDQYKENAYWVNLESFTDLFDSLRNAGGAIELNFDDEQQVQTQAVLDIENFDDLYEWGTTFQYRYDRFIAELDETNGARIDAEKLFSFLNRAKNLISEINENDSENDFDSESEILKEIKKDLKRMKREVEDSFWGTTKCVLATEI